MEVSSEDDGLSAELAAMRPDQTDVFARSLHASIRRSLVGVADEPLRLGRFTVLETLGGGGMGVVFVAHDSILERKVALKVLHNAGERGRREALREGRALARLVHPHVVTVHEVGEIDDHVFVAMEYVEGHNLRAWLRAPRTTAQIVACLVEAGRGLAAAHAVGLVHRDFKPENVLIDALGHARVIDFGLARPISGPPESTPPAADASHPGASLRGGTPAYMAPERLAGAAADHRSDQYSLCVTCWEALFGARPGEAGSRAAPARRVPKWLRRVLERGLSRAPGDRWPSIDALLAALRADPTRRRRALAGVVAVGLVVAGWFAAQDCREARRSAACAAAGASIDEVWNEDVRTRLRDGLLATCVAYAGTTADTVVASFAAQADALRRARTQACTNTRIQATWDDDIHERSLWCLDERRMELEALIGELSRADVVAVEAAVEAAAGLSPVGPCLDADRLARLPPLPRDREGVRAVLREDARALALRVTGRHEAGLREAQETLVVAEALGWAPLTARVRRRSGHLLHLRGSYQEAEAALEDAFFAAARVGALEVAHEAAIDLVRLVGSLQARHVDAIRWSRHLDIVRCALEGSDEWSLRRASADRALAQVHASRADHAQARALLERGLLVQERAHGPDHPQVAAILNDLGDVHRATKALDLAEAVHERALAIQMKVLGREHPDVAHTLIRLASVALADDRPVEAKPWAERALAILTGSEAPTARLADARLALAQALWAAPADEGQDHARAQALARQARDDLRAAGGAADVLARVEAFLARHAGEP